MELYIQIRNGQPFEHPIMGDNFCQAFPHIDLNNLPPEFAVFVRKEVPDELKKIHPDFFVVNSEYVWENGCVTDSYFLREMNEEEKTAHLEHLKNAFDSELLYCKETSLQNAEKETNNDYKQIWLDYVTLLNTLTFSYPEKVPAMPRYNSAGELLSVTASGGVPNVLG
jgi:hypothetical protein